MSNDPRFLSPLLGFDKGEISRALQRSRKLKVVAAKYLKQRESCGSPVIQLFLSKKMSFVRKDDDSGYSSQNQESEMDLLVSSAKQLPMASSDVKDVYLSEDTLLEKPELSASNQLDSGSCCESTLIEKAPESDCLDASMNNSSVSMRSSTVLGECINYCIISQ